MTAPDAPIVVPVGHLFGPSHRGGDHDVVIRLGGTLERLDDDEFAVWWLAHGLAERLDEPWTAEAMDRAAVNLALPDVGPVIDGLLARGLLTEVRRRSPGAVDFARRHRVLPLMLGLGNSPEEPYEYQIGFFTRPVIGLPGTLYDIWHWSPVDDHLWNACRGAAEVATRVGIDDPDESDPEALLDAFLEVLHPLLHSSAAAVDRRRGPGVGP